MKLKKTIEPYLWILPSMILLVIFTFYPFFKTCWLSFNIVNTMGEVKKFVGLENYSYILHDKNFLQAMRNTLIYVLVSVPISNVLGLILAMFANKRRKCSRIYEVMFSLPMAMSMSVSAIIFQLMYNPTFGVINYVTGLTINWLNDERYALLAISIVSIWMSTGYAFLFMLAAVRSIPEDVVESAGLEGANSFQKFLYIYVPLTSPTMFFLMCTGFASSMMMTALVNVLTEGGPFGSTQTIIYYMYEQFAVGGNYTNAFPAAVIGFILSAIIMAVSFLFEKKGVHYQ